jgi:hypothetical protein
LCGGGWVVVLVLVGSGVKTKSFWNSFSFSLAWPELNNLKFVKNVLTKLPGT